MTLNLKKCLCLLLMTIYLNAQGQQPIQVKSSQPEQTQHAVQKKTFHALNALRKVELHEGRFSTQLLFYFTNPLFCKKRVDHEKQLVKIGFPGMVTKHFKQAEITTMLSKLQAQGLLSSFSLEDRSGSLPQVNLSMTFPSVQQSSSPSEHKESSVIVKWTHLEAPTRLMIDIFTHAQLEALKKQSNILLYASNNIIQTSHSLASSYGHKTNKEIRVVIDPGHGGIDPGCVNHGLKEKEITLAIAEKVRTFLAKDGFHTSLTRNKDQTLSLQARSSLADQMQADIFVSIHANSAAHISSEVSGLETYHLRENIRCASEHSGYFGLNKTNLAQNLQDLLERSVNFSAHLAQEIQEKTLEAVHKQRIPCVDRGIKQNSAVVLLRNLVPSALVEVGYTSHKEEAARLATDSYQELLAFGIYKGIASYIKTHYA